MIFEFYFLFQNIQECICLVREHETYMTTYLSNDIGLDVLRCVVIVEEQLVELC